MAHLSGWDKQGGVPCLRRNGYAQAGRHFAVLTYGLYAPRVKHKCVTLRNELSRETLWDLASCSRPYWTDFFEHSQGRLISILARMGMRRV